MNKSEINIFRELFVIEYNYIALYQISDDKLSKYLSQSYVLNKSIGMQLSLCADWCQAQ